MFLKRIGLAFASFFFILQAHAEVQLNGSRLWVHPQPLSVGQEIFSFETVYQNISDRFNPGESAQPFGQPYSRTLTWGALMRADTATSAELQSYMQAHHLSAGDVAAVSHYHVDLQQTVFSLNWKYGLTQSWSIGFQLPIKYTVTNVKNDVATTGEMNPQLYQRVRELAQADLMNSGYYEVSPTTRQFTFGDASLINGVSLIHGYDWSWSLQQLVRIPTSQNPDLSDYIQTSADEGQIDLGLASLTEYRHKRWTLGARFGGVSQLPDTAKMRLANSQVDSQIHRDLGDWLWGAADLYYQFGSRIKFNFEYAFLTKSRDQYRGTVGSIADYQELGDGTDQRLHQSRVGLNYNITKPTSRGGIRDMWIASLGYTVPWIGANTLDASRASFELISYF